MIEPAPLVRLLFVNALLETKCPNCEKHVKLKVTQKVDGIYRECVECGTLIGFSNDMQPEEPRKEERPVRRLSFWEKVRRLVRTIRKERR